MNELTKAAAQGLTAIERLDAEMPAWWRIGEVMAKSQMFDITRPEQAVVKMLIGRELGMQPGEALRSIHVVKGKPMLGANVYASRLRRHPDYDYRVVPGNDPDRVCAIEFFATHGKARREEWELLGVHVVTIDKAVGLGWDKGKDTYQKHPDAMLFARCISQGSRLHCPDALNGFYTDGEIEPEPEPIDSEEVYAEEEDALDAAFTVHAQAREPREGACPATGGMHCWGAVGGGVGCVANRERCDAMQAWPAKNQPEVTSGAPGPGASGETEGEARGVADPDPSPPEGAYTNAPVALAEAGSPVVAGVPTVAPAAAASCTHPSVTPDGEGVVFCDVCSEVVLEDEPPAEEA